MLYDYNSFDKTKKYDIVYFVIRIGGWDGIALQVEQWLDIFVSKGKKVLLVTGEMEEEHGTLNVHPYNKVDIVHVPEIHIDVLKKVYKASYKDRYVRDEWIEEFVKDKRMLKTKFKKFIDCGKDVFLHNISIKHLIPTMWGAMYEIMREQKTRRFISVDADSPYERSYLMEKFSPDVLRILGRPRKWYKKSKMKILDYLSGISSNQYRALPGPDLLPNLYHIVLNSYQTKVCHNIYGIGEKNLFTIHDIASFTTNLGRKKKEDSKEMNKFFRYLEQHQLINPQPKLNNKDFVYFVSPVRPIKRKKLREVAYICKLFEHYLKKVHNKDKKVVLVITHPNKDDVPYYKTFKLFAKELKVTFVYLGTDLKLRKPKSDKKTFVYEDVMKNFALLNSVCIVGSEFGGWENGILEATQFKIPVCVNPLLPSFQDMSALGYNYISSPISLFYDLRKTEFNTSFLKFPSIDTFFDKIYERIYVKKIREINVNHNYKVGLKTQSRKAAALIFDKIVSSQATANKSDFGEK